jgi:outer membrane protein TolC
MTKIQIVKTMGCEHSNIRISNLFRGLDFEFRISFCLIWSLVGLCFLTGCTQSDYKADADEKVYNIIEQKWRQEFGSKANYRVSDVAPSPNDIQIAKTIPAGGVLTLPQAVAIATAHNRDYQLEKETLYTKALDLRLMRHTFETQFFTRLQAQDAKYEGDRFRTVGAGIEPRFNPDRLGQDIPIREGPLGTENELDPDEVTIGPGLGFNQLLMGGTMIGANLAFGWSRLLTGPWKGERFFQVLGLQVTQPLLRGRDRRVVIENLTQAERDALYQLRLFSRFRKTFVVLVITQYYQILQLSDAVNNARENYDALTWLGSRVEKLVAAGRLPAEESDRVRQEILQARDAYLQAQKEHGLMLDWFKITLGMPTTAEFQLDEAELNSLRAMEISYPDFSEVQAIEAALARRLDLANSDDAIADAERKVLVAADALGAELNLQLNANIPLHDLYGDNKSDLGDFLLAALEMDLPLDRVAEQNVFRKALLTLNQRKREHELAQDTVRLEIRQAYRDLTEAIERYRVSSQGLKLAQKRFNSTLLLMKYGRASSRRVLNAQNALFDAQNTASEALVNYMIATLNFYRDTGVLHVRPDGMWEKGTAGNLHHWSLNTP